MKTLRPVFITLDGKQFTVAEFWLECELRRAERERTGAEQLKRDVPASERTE